MRFRALKRAFGSLADAWAAPVEQLRAAGIDNTMALKIGAQRKQIDPQAELEHADRLGVRLLTWNDADYPYRLKETHDPPPVLYIKGKPAWDDDRCVAMIGTWTPTHYGMEATRVLSSDLAKWA